MSLCSTTGTQSTHSSSHAGSFVFLVRHAPGYVRDTLADVDANDLWCCWRPRIRRIGEHTAVLCVPGAIRSRGTPQTRGPVLTRTASCDVAVTAVVSLPLHHSHTTAPRPRHANVRTFDLFAKALSRNARAAHVFK
jgi:hypothetical protein